MPVSARRHAGVTELGNQVGAVPVSLPATGDPIGRLVAVGRITRKRRTAAAGSSAAVIAPAFRLLAMLGVCGWFVDRQRLVNTFVSNLHGPEHRLSFLGAPVVDVIAVSGIVGNVTVACLALSYAGSLNVTVVADPDCCPDLDGRAEALHSELRIQSTPT